MPSLSLDLHALSGALQTVAVAVALILSVATFVRQWREMNTKSAVSLQAVDCESRDVDTREWVALLNAYKALLEKAEARLIASIEESEAARREMAELTARLAEMEERHDREREAWLREREELRARIIELQARIRTLEAEREALRLQLERLADAQIRGNGCD